MELSTSKSSTTKLLHPCNQSKFRRDFQPMGALGVIQYERTKVLHVCMELETSGTAMRQERSRATPWCAVCGPWKQYHTVRKIFITRNWRENFLMHAPIVACAKPACPQVHACVRRALWVHARASAQIPRNTRTAALRARALCYVVNYLSACWLVTCVPRT